MPLFHTFCREFVLESSDQTRLYWKDKKCWNSIDTTAFGLDSHNVDLRLKEFLCLPFNLFNFYISRLHFGKLCHCEFQ